jgi:mannose-6-phosphate isomerase-like protein (cupin superfamily)
MTEHADDKHDNLRGADKKEAFHRAAEARVKTFKFDGGDPEVKSVSLAELPSCQLRIQVLRKGMKKRSLHYHPNQDQVYMVLRGRIRYYGADDKPAGELGPMEGIAYPENARYWIENIGEEETWLMHVATYPRGAEHAKAIDLSEPSRSRRKPTRAK